jgi:hypothetical protein
VTKTIESNKSNKEIMRQMAKTARRLKNSQRFYDSLKRISLYQSRSRMRGSGLGYLETLEQAYDSIIGDAERALSWRRRPE